MWIEWQWRSWSDYQTAPWAVLFGSALFAYACLSENIGTLRYVHYSFVNIRFRRLLFFGLFLGEMVRFDAIDQGENRHLARCTAQETLHLKVLRATVILIVNLSSQLVNGLQGVITQINIESVIVMFDTLKREEVISFHTYTVFSPEAQRDLATRKQLPPKLSFALTVHKA